MELTNKKCNWKFEKNCKFPLFFNINRQLNFNSRNARMLIHRWWPKTSIFLFIHLIAVQKEISHIRYQMSCVLFYIISIHNAIQRSSEWLNFTVNQYIEAHSYRYVSIYIICSVIFLWAWWKTHVNSISRTHLENVNWFRTHRIWNCVMNVNRPPLRSKLNWESWISAIETSIHRTGVPVRRYADTMSCISRKDGDNVTISKEGKNIDSCNWKLIFHQLDHAVTVAWSTLKLNKF